MKIIVGLGNPGERHEGTRHNIGWVLVDEIARRHGIALMTIKFHSFFGSGRIGDMSAALLKPTTYMNDSGLAVSAAVNFYNCALDDLLVICDDIALPPGVLRLRREGGTGGHRGLASVEEQLGTDVYPRLRLGIGRGPMDDQREYVLSRFTKEDEAAIKPAVVRGADAVECWTKEGIEACMNRYNA